MPEGETWAQLAASFLSEGENDQLRGTPPERRTVVPRIIITCPIAERAVPTGF